MPARPLLLLGLLLAASPAGAHEIDHQVARGNAVAVRATEDGQGLADVPYEVYSPADRQAVWARGRTDRAGWLAFVPDVAGRWRVRVIEDDGHGFDVELEAGPQGGATAPPPSGLGRALRPGLGVVVIVALFAALWLSRRRKR